MRAEPRAEGAAGAGAVEGGEAPSALPAEVIADLRTDHAGETGAVCIYTGVLCMARDPALQAFAWRHRATEEAHLQRIEAWLPVAERSRLLPLWRVAGWLTGALPALFGPKAVYGTIAAVERFVDEHYADQVTRFADRPALQRLASELEACRLDEVAHRDEASNAGGAGAPGWAMRAWARLVDAGSRAAVAVCRHV